MRRHIFKVPARRLAQPRGRTAFRMERPARGPGAV